MLGSGNLNELKYEALSFFHADDVEGKINLDEETGVKDPCLLRIRFASPPVFRVDLQIQSGSRALRFV